MEVLDDVQFDEGGSPKELLQSKHRIDSPADLTDTSVDLWRTINVWISAMEELQADELPALTLLSTATAPEPSAAAYLRAGEGRSPERALELLRAAGHTSVNVRTQPWRKRFTRLGEAARRSLFEAITVCDGAATIDRFDEELRGALQWGLPPGAEQAAAFVDHIKGWWLGVAVRLLRRDLPAYAATDMLTAVGYIRDQYGADNLPTDPELPDPDTARDGDTLASGAERAAAGAAAARCGTGARRRGGRGRSCWHSLDDRGATAAAWLPAAAALV